MIVARRLALKGKQVLGVAELSDHGGGLYRNRVQCLEEFRIPLWLSTTVTRLHGIARLEGVTLRHADGSEREVACDTLVTSVGLLPERELLDGFGGEGLPPWLFSCGNAEHIYDLVDRAAGEAARLGGEIARWLQGGAAPQRLAEPVPATRQELPSGELLCLCCPRGCRMTREENGAVTGAQCARGESFFRQEMLEKRRFLTMVVEAEGCQIPLRTTLPIPRTEFDTVLEQVGKLRLTLPVRAGQAVLKNPGNCGADVVAQCSVQTENKGARCNQ